MLRTSSAVGRAPRPRTRLLAAGVTLAAALVATPVAALASSASSPGGAAVAAAGARVGEVVRARPVVTPSDLRPTDTRPTDLRPTDTRPTDTRPTDTKPTETQPTDTRPTPDRPSPRFACEAYRTDAGPAIACKWAQVGEDRAAGYRLWRAVDDQARRVVFETRDLTEHGYRDLDVKPGHTFHYAVQYLAADGSVIVTSEAVRIRIPGDRPEVEALRLACEQLPRETADAPVVACKWSAASTERVVGYQLIRKDAEGREVVARGGRDFTSHREKVRPGRYAYRVVGVDAEGRVVAASDAAAVHVG